MKICKETVCAALEPAVSSISLSDWDRQRILRAVQHKQRPAMRHWLVRRAGAGTLGFALAVVLAMGVLAAVPSLAEKLNMLNQKTLAYFTPIEKQSEDADIRMEVIAAMNDGDTAIVYISLQDVSGQNRLDDTTWVRGIQLDGLDTTICDNAYRKPDGTVILRLIGQCDSGTLAGRKVTFRMENVLSQNSYRPAVDTGCTVADIRAWNPNPSLGSRITADSYELNGALEGPLYTLLEGGKLQTLKAGTMPQKITNLPWLEVQNAGVLDGNLHLLTDPADTAWYNSARFFLADGNGIPYDTDTAVVELDQKAFSRMYDEQGGGQEEQIINLPANTAEQDMHLYYSADEYGMAISGKWNVTFALQPESVNIQADCDVDMKPWHADSIRVSAIGITVEGSGEMLESSLSPEISICLLDGTVLQEYSGSSTTVLDGESGEPAEIQMKSFFDEPIDPNTIKSIMLNGTCVWQKT